MDEILSFLKYFVEQLLGRLERAAELPPGRHAHGGHPPRAASRLEGRPEGRPAFLGAFITDPVERRRLFRIGVKDAGRVFLMAIVLDTAYQLMVFRWVYPGQLLIVAVVCAVVPYVLVRGPDHAPRAPAATASGPVRRTRRRRREPLGRSPGRRVDAMNLLRRYLPILTWGAEYSRQTFTNDLIVAVIVTVMLIPQSLAYALLAGLPVQVGLFASMAPLLLYAVFGTSRTPRRRARGGGEPDDRGRHQPARVPGHARVPRRGHRARPGLGADADRHGAAAARVPRELPQPPGRLGVHHRLGPPDRGRPARRPSSASTRRARPSSRSSSSLVPNLGHINPATAAIGLGVAGVPLLGARQPQAPAAPRRALAERTAGTLAKIGPAVALVVTTLAVWGLGLDQQRRQDRRRGPQGPAPARRCRLSTWRSGRSSSCPRC